MSTPTCPVCGAKFSHDSQLQACKVCGVTDEAIYAGKAASYRRRLNRQVFGSKRNAKRNMRYIRHPQRDPSTKKKHGRQVKV